MDLRHLTEQIRSRLQTLQNFNATPGEGVTRFPFTPEARAASNWLRDCMEQAGLQVRLDNSGSVIGRLEGEVPETMMIGSHLDSVLHGGAYDGIAGVICAISAVELLQARGIKSHYSIEVIATNDEEGSRFKSGLFTGKVLGGQLTPDDIRSYRDADGISVYEAMEQYGLHPEEIAQHVRNDIRAFLEVHIEQGPVLEAAGKDIGVVDVIVGIRRLLVTIEGRADHIGTTPMDVRKDALEAATQVISKIGDRARQFPQAVATVGNLTVEPNILNIVPSKVTYTVDFRGTTPEVIEQQSAGMLADLQAVTKRFGMRSTTACTLDAAPVEMNIDFRRWLEESCKANGFSNMHLISGAGHDAEVFGARMPACMIFVPSIGGRSHCPEEKTDERTLAMAAVVACDTLERIDRERAL